MGLGETGFPKGLLGTIQSIRVTGNPIFSIFETFPQQNHVFPTPGLAQNIAQAESGARFGILDPIWDSGSQKWSLGPKTKRMRAGTIQNPAARIRNGAIWSKLWPKSILAPWGKNPCCNKGTLGHMGHSGNKGHISKVFFFSANTGTNFQFSISYSQFATPGKAHPSKAMAKG